MGEASEWATLSAEDAGPEGGAIGKKGIVGFRVDHEPGLLRELVLKLPSAPPRVSGVQTRRMEQRCEVERIELQVDHAEIAEHRDKPGHELWVSGPTEAPAALVPHGAADVHHGRIGGDVLPTRERDCDCDVGGTVQHETERTVGVVLQHQDHGALEVGVPEHGLGYQQTARRRGHRWSLAPSGAYGDLMLPDGTYDVFVVDADTDGEPDKLRVELTILAGQHKGEIVSMRTQGLGVDEIGALGLPGTLTVRAGQPYVTLDT